MTDKRTPRPDAPLTSADFPVPGHDHITQKLRELYETVQDEGIPDKFLDLLERLDEAERKASGGGS
jgi:hypothetical protein